MNQKIQYKKWRSVILLGFFFIFLVWMIWGNTSIEVSRITIQKETIPDEFNGFKIAHLSDLHNRNWGERLIGLLEEEQPDLIAITGDLIDSSNTDLYTALDFVNRAKVIAPVYYVTGNQEAVSEQYDLLEEGLRELDVVLLDDEAIKIEDTAEISVLGLEDSLFMMIHYPWNDPSYRVDTKLKQFTEEENHFKLLLSHRPELFDLYVENGIDLVLSGHAHGGQFRLPFIGGLFAPDQGFFPDYTTGLYQEKGTNMVVSRGLGNSSIPIRFNNRAELIFIELNNGS